MKVILAVHSIHPFVGGPATSIAMIGATLAARGINSSYWTKGGRLYGARGPKAGTLQALHCDLIHSFGIWKPFNEWVSWIARLSDHPLVICPMGMLAPWSLTQKRFKKRVAFGLYQRRMLDRAQVLHATAELDIRNFRSLNLKAPIALMTHGVDVPTSLPPRLEPSPDFTGRSRRTALFLSRLHPGKGLLDLVRVWARLRPEGWRVVIAGPDEDNHKAEVEATIHDAKLEDTFSFRGHISQENKGRLFMEADLFLLPTYSENFGMVVPEALAHGLPVITTTGAPWAAIAETRSGWWVEPGEAGLQSALSEALELDISELRAMGQRGREMVSARYSWDSVITRHIELYRWLVSGEKKPAFVFD